MAPRERLEALAKRHGLHLVGVTSAAADARRPRSAWRRASPPAAWVGMGWMGGSRPAQATDPRRHDPDARSVIAVAAPYVGAERAAWDDRPGALHRSARARPRRCAAPSPPGGSPATRSAATTTARSAARLEGLAADLRASGIAGGRNRLRRRPAAGRARAGGARPGWAGSARTRTCSPTSAPAPGSSSARSSPPPSCRLTNRCARHAAVHPVPVPAARRARSSRRRRSTRGAASAT